jgi:hypothetical protein
MMRPIGNSRFVKSQYCLDSSRKVAVRSMCSKHSLSLNSISLNGAILFISLVGLVVRIGRLIACSRAIGTRELHIMELSMIVSGL